MKLKLFFTMLFSVTVLCSFSQNRWEINSSGGITWNVKEGDSHLDHIEMAGQQVATVLRYGVEPSGAFRLERSMVFPLLRIIPNDTHASLMQRFAIDIPSTLIVNGQTLHGERAESISLDGKMTVKSNFKIGIKPGENNIEIIRTIFPSMQNPMLIEGYSLRNSGEKPITVLVPDQKNVYQTPEKKGVDGSYTMIQGIDGNGTYTVEPGGEIKFTAYILAHKKHQQASKVDFAQELGLRESFVATMWNNLVLETPDENINRAFAFSKIRASESIYRTAGGYMHGPGGESYYAAIWANDQAEYVNPFFPYLGYNIANESAINSYRHFARFMNDQYKPIPSSIIAEGIDIWNGAGDRGDAAMIAYGASRYALERADKAQAQELWKLIEWCLEFSKRKTNSGGVIASDSDELENRFPSGEANLCTSSLHYDALNSAIYLGREIGVSAEKLEAYRQEAAQLKVNIEKYFGVNVEGFDTYQYYDGNDILRSWICIPLTVGIYDRAEQTVKALFSPRLWTKDGLLTQAGSETFWDRSTLYGLRGTYCAGYPDLATDYLKKYSQTRLLGDHVPYPIEAYPEGDQRHLSAESGLYARIFTEGLFGIRPTGFASFNFVPQLPSDWNRMSLRNIQAFGGGIDIEVVRNANGKLDVKVTRGGNVVKSIQIKSGETISVVL